jgi:hypothetical protein
MIQSHAHLLKVLAYPTALKGQALLFKVTSQSQTGTVSDLPIRAR